MLHFIGFGAALIVAGLGLALAVLLASEDRNRPSYRDGSCGEDAGSERASDAGGSGCDPSS
jgi:hypothetical protein